MKEVTEKFCDVAQATWEGRRKEERSVMCVSETLLQMKITARSPHVNTSDILRRTENIDRPVAFEPLMKPSVLKIAFMYRQALSKFFKLQGVWCCFHRA
jgi:hypothetical protein